MRVSINDYIFVIDIHVFQKTAKLEHKIIGKMLGNSKLEFLTII